jgi:hypothetical protein
MRPTLVFLSLVFSFLNAHADALAPVRQATLTVTIEKTIFEFDQDGRPQWISSPVCTQQGFINVYQELDESWTSLYPADLRLIHCESELAGKKISVAFGGAVGLFQLNYAGTLTPMKGVALFLSWGDFDMETLQIVHSPVSDPWLKFQDVLAPVSSGKIIDGVPQAPEPAEYFSAKVSIEDGIR